MHSVSETPAFVTLAQDYQRKHNKLREDIDWLKEKLAQAPSAMGDRPPELQKFKYPIFKTRLKDSCHKIGQRGGWRVFYAVDIGKVTVYLLLLYHKNEEPNPKIKKLFKKIEIALSSQS